LKRLHCWIEGRVQGVAFRAYTQYQAHLLGVSGWVRNLPDGRVEAVFEGDDAAVEAMVKWCRQGPPAARVTAVEVVEEEPGRTAEGFVIRYR